MPGDYVYKIESGTIDISMRDPDGEEVFLAELGPGEIIGEMAVMLGGRRCASARAHGDVVLSRIPGQELHKRVKRSGAMHAYMMRLIADRAIRNISLFAGLSAEEKASLPKGEGPVLYPKKSYLFRENEPIAHLYVLCSGHVQHFNTTDTGQEITVELHKPGDVFCKSAACLHDGFFSTSTRAIDDAYVIKLPIGQFKEVMRRYETVADRLLFSLARRNMINQYEMEQRATMTAPQILSSFLRRLCYSYGFDPHGFTLPYKKSLVAARLGMETETLSRAWAKLAEYGIIVDGTRITILDEEA
ncbi:MAG: cyclic nucleotide-binding domain-containing protein [Alphaproteobacteria bacterium]|nr:cyclic nucleotide-binding domain-containing protein [Alphaproteobacteria bacterium]